MVKVNTWSGLITALEKVATAEIVNEVAKTVKTTLEKKLQSLWYDKHTNESFTRTFELIQSVDVTPIRGVAGIYNATVHFVDGGSHTQWDGSFIDNQAIAWFLEYGNKGGSPEYTQLGHGDASRNGGVGYAEKTTTYYNTRFKTAMREAKKALKAKGIYITIA